MVKYWEFKDRVREASRGKTGRIESTGEIGRFLIWMPLPQSWSKKKKAAMRGQPHQAETGDLDNITKSFLDALFERDGFIWKIGHLEKRWEDEQGPRIEVWD